MLLRAINPSQDVTQQVARAYYGTSKDGIHFKIDDGPVLAPSTNNYNKDGCEDATAVKLEDKYLVYYTGWNVTKRERQLMFASGKNVRKLEVEKIAIKRKEPYLNPKEATVEQLINVKWSLFFEYANDNKSKVGRAFSKKPEGPWIIEGEFLKTREDSWNSYHLSVALALRWITSTIKR